MELSVAALAAAVVVFIVTNIDDIVILGMLYSDPRIGRRAVVIGQYIGIAALTAASAVVAYLALAIPPGWTSLLGVVPLAIGIRKFIELRSPQTEDAASTDLASGSSKFAQIATVTAVTIASGGDNLSVYIPLFANDTSIIPSYVVAFMALTGVWCVLGYALVKNPAGAAVIGRWGHILLPLVLVIIGAQILWGARVLFQ